MASPPFSSSPRRRRGSASDASDASDASSAVDGNGADGVVDVVVIMLIIWIDMLLWEYLSGKRHRNRNKNAGVGDVGDVTPDGVASLLVAPLVAPLVETLPLTKTPILAADLSDRLTVAFQATSRTPLLTRRHSRRQRRRDDLSCIFERKRLKYFPIFIFNYINLIHSALNLTESIWMFHI